MHAVVRWLGLRSVGVAVLAVSLMSGCAGSDADAATETESSQPAVSKVKIFTDRTAGKLCTSDADCGNGFCRYELPTLPGNDPLPAADGFCTFSCRLHVDCGAEGACIGAGQNAFAFGFEDETGLCLAVCDVDRPCREGYRCEDLFGLPIVDGMSDTGSGVGSCRPPSSAE